MAHISSLFLIFINHLPKWIRDGMMLLFADDTKTYRKIMEVKDEVLFQQDLDSLVSWTRK